MQEQQSQLSEIKSEISYSLGVTGDDPPTPNDTENKIIRSKSENREKEASKKSVSSSDSKFERDIEKITDELDQEGVKLAVE